MIEFSYFSYGWEFQNSMRIGGGGGEWGPKIGWYRFFSVPFAIVLRVLIHSTHMFVKHECHKLLGYSERLPLS